MKGSILIILVVFIAGGCSSFSRSPAHTSSAQAAYGVRTSTKKAGRKKSRKNKDTRAIQKERPHSNWPI